MTVTDNESDCGAHAENTRDLTEDSVEGNKRCEENCCEEGCETHVAVSLLTEKLEAGVAQILEIFEQKLAYDNTKQQQIDRLHAELQEHRADLIARTNRPLVNGLIRLHDDVGKLIDNFKRQPDQEVDPARFFKAFENVQDDIEILLDQNGVVSFSEQGERLDPRRQHVSTQIKTSDEQLIGMIAGRLRKGFEQADDLIRKERVSVYVLDESIADLEDCSNDEVESELSPAIDPEISSDLEE